MKWVIRGSLYDEITRSWTTVYFSGFQPGRKSGWPMMSENSASLVYFLSVRQARSFLRDIKKAFPHLDRFVVAKHPSITENRD